MVRTLIELSARNRALVFLLTAALTVASWWAVRNVPLDAVPDLSDPGDVPHHVGAAQRTACDGCARRVHVWDELHLCAV